jgi:hypothetical protein
VRQYAAEFWRVLRDDGIFWLNLGDSYAGSGGAGEWSKRKAGKKEYAGPRNNANRVVKSLPAKNLIGTPWRCALALQADGWTLRAAPPWIKKNPMPESTKDRPNTGHEYWFMLTKGQTYQVNWQNNTGKTETNPSEKTTHQRNSKNITLTWKRSDSPTQIQKERITRLGKKHIKREMYMTIQEERAEMMDFKRMPKVKRVMAGTGEQEISPAPV